MSDQCKQRVFSGARYDMSGHLCNNKAVNDTEFCHLHGGRPTEDRRAEATGRPAVSSSTTHKYRAELRWARGTGPVVPLPYTKGFGFLDKAVMIVEVTGEKRSERILVYGTKQRLNGEPGNQPWDTSLSGEKFLGERWLARLREALKLEMTEAE